MNLRQMHALAAALFAWITIRCQSLHNAARLFFAPFIIVLLAGLSSCGGGGTIPGTGVALRALPADFATRQAVAYSPYRSANRATETITLSMIREDLRLLTQAGIGLIRLFDSSDVVARQTLQVITEDGLDIKVMLGIWIAPNAESANLAEIDRGIALARQFETKVAAVSVGNETLVSWSGHKVTAGDLARYIGMVRSQVRQPVTTDDNWAVFAARPGEQNIQSVLDAIDFVAMHTYALLDTIHNPAAWNWKQESVPESERAAAMMDAGLRRTRDDHAAVRTELDARGLSAMPVIIGETGWKAEASGGEERRAHPVNQKMFFERLQAWKAQAGSPFNIVWFEAFDEPWKLSDDKWGLFDVQRRARCVVQGLNPAFVAAPGPCSASSALYYLPIASAGPVTASLYRVYRDTSTPGEATPVVAPLWNAWENGTTANAVGVSDNSDPADSPFSWRINPTPAVWGWGMALVLTDSAENLSAFNVPSGRLNFSIRTTYPGKIEVGFLTGTASDGSLYDVYLAISPGSHGYQNDGQWHQVSIPLQSIIAAGAPAFGYAGSPTAVLDLTRVTNVFVIGDRFGITLNASGAKPSILLDNIYWSR